MSPPNWFRLNFSAVRREEALASSGIPEKTRKASREIVGCPFLVLEDGGARAAARIGRSSCRSDLEFPNVVDGRKSADTTGGQFVVVDAVEKPIGAVRRDPRRRARRNRGRRPHWRRSGIEETVGIGLGGGLPKVRVASCTKSRPLGEVARLLGGDGPGRERAGGFRRRRPRR